MIEYIVGTMTSVRMVANSRPKMTAMAIGPQNSAFWPPMRSLKLVKSKLMPSAIGTRPRIVVIAVSMTGLKRVIPALTRASLTS